MKTYYYFRAQNAPLSASSVIYKIAVGVSDRDLMSLPRWKQICFDNGYTFMIWDESVKFYLDFERERVFGDSCPVRNRFMLVSMSLTQLIRIYRSCGFSFFESSINPSTMYFQQMRSLFPAYLFNRFFSKKNSKSPIGKRKNLSHSLRQSKNCARV